MGKEEFIERLERLLADLPDGEKQEALGYYRDYLEEAGPEQEEAVLREFGSPERIASIIRVDLAGGMENAGEFTETGYTDHRFETASYPVPKEPATEPDSGGGSGENSRESARTDSGETFRDRKGTKPYQPGSYSDSQEGRKRRWGLLRIILTAVLILVAIPFMLSAGVGAAGLLIAAFIVLAVGLVALALLTAAGFFGGFSLLVVGITHVMTELWFGVLCIGMGLMAFGAGCLLLLCSFLFYGKLIPWMVRGVGKMCGRIWGGGQRRDKKEETYNERQKSSAK